MSEANFYCQCPARLTKAESQRRWFWGYLPARPVWTGVSWIPFKVWMGSPFIHSHFASPRHLSPHPLHWMCTGAPAHDGPFTGGLGGVIVVNGDTGVPVHSDPLAKTFNLHTVPCITPSPPRLLMQRRAAFCRSWLVPPGLLVSTANLGWKCRMLLADATVPWLADRPTSDPIALKSTRRRVFIRLYRGFPAWTQPANEGPGAGCLPAPASSG